jgi:hypothetical protein
MQQRQAALVDGFSNHPKGQEEWSSCPFLLLFTSKKIANPIDFTRDKRSFHAFLSAGA